MSSTHNNLTNKSHGNPLRANAPFNHVPDANPKSVTLERKLAALERTEQAIRDAREQLNKGYDQLRHEYLCEKYKNPDGRLDVEGLAKAKTQVTLDDIRYQRNTHEARASNAIVGSTGKKLFRGREVRMELDVTI